MEWVFPLVEDATSVTGVGGSEWLAKDEAWPADHPFVLANLGWFTNVPPKVRSASGAVFERLPLSQPAAAPARRGRANG